MEMTTSKAIEVLKAHNEWRRDDNIPNSKAMVNPTELGKALDKAIEVMGLVEGASMLVGNPGTNISGGTDLACIEWQRKYKEIT